VKTTFWVVFNRRGADRITKKHPPTMVSGEVAVCMVVEISDANFRTPLAEASLVIGDNHVIQPEVEVSVLPPAT
jgi:hypothetical protein